MYPRGLSHVLRSVIMWQQLISGTCRVMSLFHFRIHHERGQSVLQRGFYISTNHIGADVGEQAPLFPPGFQIKTFPKCCQQCLCTWFLCGLFFCVQCFNPSEPQKRYTYIYIFAHRVGSDLFYSICVASSGFRGVRVFHLIMCGLISTPSL